MMKKLFFSLTLLLVSLSTNAQNALLDPEALDEKPIFESMGEALKNPLQVYKLTLYSQGLTEVPKEIAKLKNLQQLSLNNNKITTLSAEIWGLKNLQKLNLSGNQIAILPQEISKLQNLQDLNLSQNQFTTLPNQIGSLVNL